MFRGGLRGGRKGSLGGEAVLRTPVLRVGSAQAPSLARAHGGRCGGPSSHLWRVTALCYVVLVARHALVGDSSPPPPTASSASHAHPPRFGARRLDVVGGRRRVCQRSSYFVTSHHASRSHERPFGVLRWVGSWSQLWCERHGEREGLDDICGIPQKRLPMSRACVVCRDVAERYVQTRWSASKCDARV